jgi:hypothetical protein
VPVVISVLDVRDTLVPPRIDRPEQTPPATTTAQAPGTTPARRRTPATAVVLAAGGVVQGLAIVAAALTVLAHLLGSAHRPSGVLVGAALVVLACWVVLAAAAGACVLDGTGHRLLTAVCYAELGLLAALVVAGSVTPVFDRLGSPLPVSALALLAVAVPVGKLLLAGAPSTTAWLAQGPRVREQRPDPVAAHRLLCTLTLGVIALALTVTAVLVPSPADAGRPATVSSSAH